MDLRELIDQTDFELLRTSKPSDSASMQPVKLSSGGNFAPTHEHVILSEGTNTHRPQHKPQDSTLATHKKSLKEELSRLEQSFEAKKDTNLTRLSKDLPKNVHNSSQKNIKEIKPPAKSTKETPSADNEFLQLSDTLNNGSSPTAGEDSKLNVQPQREVQNKLEVFDADAQEFRGKLEALTASFRREALTEFLRLKRSMQETQRECVRSDTQKYLSLYEEKSQELVKVKGDLATVTRTAERSTLQGHLLADHIALLRRRLEVARLLSRPFATLRTRAQMGRVLKAKNLVADKLALRKLTNRAWNGWRRLSRTNFLQRLQQSTEQRIDEEVQAVVAKYEQETESLRTRLEEALRKNEEFERNRQMMQENLKKAFLRGISAMNMQAMGLFGDESLPTLEAGSRSEVVDRSESSFARTANRPANWGDVSESLPSQSSMEKRLSATHLKPKAESMEHRWKEAPILGWEQPNDSEEPRTQVVRPMSEAKVIRVVDGKSSVAEEKQGDKSMAHINRQGTVEWTPTHFNRPLPDSSKRCPDPKSFDEKPAACEGKKASDIEGPKKTGTLGGKKSGL